jgi:Fe-S cluster assembly protein SufD
MSVTSVFNPREHYLGVFREQAARLSGANLPWLKNARVRAIEQFTELGFPTTKQENWKYTSLASIDGRGFQPSMPGKAHPDCLAAMADLKLDSDAHLLVFINGHYSANHSLLKTLPAGVILASVNSVLERHPEKLEQYFGDAKYATGVGALNGALFADGYVLIVPERTEVEAAIHVLFLQTAGDTIANVKNFIVAETGSRARVIEHFAALGDFAYFNNISTEISTARDARIEHLKLQQESASASHIADIRARQQQASEFSSYSFALGGILSRNDIATYFAGEHGHCAMNGLYLTQGKQVVDHHTRIDHAKPRCVSREFYKGILDGTSRAVFNGKVIVHQDAQQTDASQSNRNLLLSDNAEVDTKPELEIYADDVKCAHGATVGQLDANQLFYLRTRGIDEISARTLLIFAFAEDLVSGLTYLPLRERMEHILMSRLPDADLLKEFL